MDKGKKETKLVKNKENAKPRSASKADKDQKRGRKDMSKSKSASRDSKSKADKKMKS